MILGVAEMRCFPSLIMHCWQACNSCSLCSTYSLSLGIKYSVCVADTNDSIVLKIDWNFLSHTNFSCCLLVGWWLWWWEEAALWEAPPPPPSPQLRWLSTHSPCSAGLQRSSPTVFLSHITPASSHQPGNSIFLSQHSSSSLPNTGKVGGQGQGQQLLFVQVL